MKLSVVMIVKNEEAILAAALDSVKDADEIIVVDTGSTDSTIEIAKRYTDKIFNFPWIDDFAAARNYAIEQATGEWIYSLDADHALMTPIPMVKVEAEKAASLGHKTALVKSISGDKGQYIHWRDVLFKNDPEVRWHGAVHESMLPAATYKVEVERYCGYSGNHAKDPNRNLRILEATAEKTPRTLFYLARENYEKRRYAEALKWLEEYLPKGTWSAELAEAWLVKARCHWFLKQGNEAREACLHAIKENPDFKEAFMLMGNMHHEPWKSMWHKLASVTTNQGVLFIRT